MTAVSLRLVLDQVLRVCAVSDHAVGSDHQAGPSCRAIGRLPTGQVNWCTRAGRCIVNGWRLAYRVVTLGVLLIILRGLRGRRYIPLSAGFPSCWASPIV